MWKRHPYLTRCLAAGATKELPQASLRKPAGVILQGGAHAACHSPVFKP